MVKGGERLHSETVRRAAAAVVIGISSLFVAAQAATNPVTEPVITNEAEYCGSIGVADQPNDYRLREVDSKVKWAYWDNWKYHARFAYESVAAGTLTEPVLSAIDWTLVRWPNHLQMLEALIRYDLGGGKRYDYLPAQCYFVRARQYAPNDTDVVLAQAYYFWKKKNFARAVDAYHEVLGINPGSRDAHYNLGLLYFERGDYENAVTHAKEAYDAGYALPGLRKKLESVGKWPAGAAPTPH